MSGMMQAAIAVANYESTFDAFPPGVVDSGRTISNGKTGYHFGWLVQLLPFLDHKNVYNDLNFRQTVYSPANLTARSRAISAYLCPSDPEGAATLADGAAPTSYFGCHNDVEAPIAATNNGVLFLNSSVRTEDIEDGASQTILLGEAKIESASLGWASGTRSSLRNTGTPINAPPVAASTAPRDLVGGFSSHHGGGANFAFCDGSVRMLTNSIAPATLKALANRKDGQAISESSY